MKIKRGTSATDILLNLLPSLGIDGVGHLRRFAVAGRMQRRIQSPEIERAVAAAKARKRETGQPFWDALYSELPFLSREARQEVFHLGQYHHSMSDVAVTTTFSLTAGAIEAAVTSESRALEVGEILAISSRMLSASGEETHLPMLDFRVAVSEENDELVPEQLHAMKLQGWLLESGRSYHFLGRSVLDGRAGLSRFLGHALLFAPLVDGRWVAHQLIEGACALRISSGNDEQISPRSVTELS
jgi:hypothetical protein